MKKPSQEYHSIAIIIAQACVDQARKKLMIIDRVSIDSANIILDKAILCMRVAYKFKAQGRHELAVKYANKSIKESLEVIC